MAIKDVIKEMFGKVQPAPAYLRRFQEWFNRITYIESVDYSKPNYNLTKAIYYASEVQDSNSKTSKVGGKFLLGAVFGKPIVNASAAFAFPTPPEVSVVNKEDDKAGKFINNWLRTHRKVLFDLCRWTIRDGDGYVYIKDDQTPFLIAPDRVEIKVSPTTGDFEGYRIHTNVHDDKTNRMVEYITKIDPDGNESTVKVQDGKETGVENIFDSDGSVLRMVDFHNEKEPGCIYGNSEYQNIYYLLANYHGVLENAIKNNIFNSNAVVYVAGVDEANAFLESNGTLQEDGTYKIDWDSNKLLIGGKDFKLSILEGAKTASEATEMLNILFWLICQASETPEFVMGTAVSSSKASVSEQMPILLQKAERKQREFEEYFRILIDRVLKIGGFGEIEYELTFAKPVEDDAKFNLELLKTLLDLGLITRKTALNIASVADYVEDVDTELDEAQSEKDEEKEKSLEYGIQQFKDQAKMEKFTKPVKNLQR